MLPNGTQSVSEAQCSIAAQADIEISKKYKLINNYIFVLGSEGSPIIIYVRNNIY